MQASGGVGLGVSSKSNPTVTNNTIFDGQLAGIQVLHPTHLALYTHRTALCMAYAMHGLFSQLWEGAGGVITDNTISRNAGGIVLEIAVETVICNNVIQDNSSPQIVADTALMSQILEKNKVTGS